MLPEIGVDVRSIRRIRAGEMILEFERDSALKGSAEEVLGAEVEVRALTEEVTLLVKNLDEVTEAEELVTALRQQREFCDRQGQRTGSSSVAVKRLPDGRQSSSREC